MSLRELFTAPESIAATCDTDLRKIAFLTCRGGWPQAALMSDDEEIALDQAIDYYDAVVNSDIQRVDDVNRDPERVKRLMRSYARFQGSQSSFTEICKDMEANEKSGLDENTISSYLNALRQIFVVEDMHAWNPNLRSKTAIRSTDTRYFVDPSIATAALGLGPEDLMNDLETFGLLLKRSLFVTFVSSPKHWTEKFITIGISPDWNAMPLFIFATVLMALLKLNLAEIV